MHEDIKAINAEFPLEYVAPGRAATYKTAILYRGDYQHEADGVSVAIRKHSNALKRTGLPVVLQSISNEVIDPETNTRVPMDYSSLPSSVLSEVDHMTQFDHEEVAAIITHCVPFPSTIRHFVFPAKRMQVDMSEEIANHLRRMNVLFLAFEQSEVDESMAYCLNSVGQVWVPCVRNKNMLVRSGVDSQRVRVVPHPFAPGDAMFSVAERRKPRDPGRRIRFLSVGKWEPRKDQHGLIGAFLSTFGPEDKAQLIIKTKPFSTWEKYPKDWKESVLQWLEHEDVKAKGWSREVFEASLKAAVSRRPLVVMTGDLPRRSSPKNPYSLEWLYELADCYVSSSRAEGFNLPAFDAKVASLPMVYVGWGGEEDFASESDWRVGADDKTEPVPKGYHFGGVWSGHTHKDIGEGLQKAFDSLRVSNWRPKPPNLYHYSPKAVGESMRRALEALGDELTIDIRGL